MQASMTENGYVYSAIEANCESKRSVGFIAHLDVVSEPKGYGVKPVVHKNDKGEDIITSDGTTVLGADDKAGVAEIMAMAEYLVNHPEVKHGRIGIAFTPDEEIGHGAKLFDVAGFGCDYAYTVDGETLGEISVQINQSGTTRRALRKLWQWRNTSSTTPKKNTAEEVLRLPPPRR